MTSRPSLVASLGRRAAKTAAVDHTAGERPSVSADIDTLGPPPSSSDLAERVTWIVARRRAERNQPEHTAPGIGLAAGR